MKKILLLAITGLALLNQTNAQVYEYETPGPAGPSRFNPSTTRFGVFLAPTIAWMKPTANRSDDGMYLVNSEGSKAGFMWGLMLDRYFAENYGISTGIQLNHMGGRISTRLNPNMATPSGVDYVRNTEFTYKIQYVEVPFGLKLRSDELPGGFRVFGGLGVTLGLAISKKANYYVSYYDYDANTDRITQQTNEKLYDLAITPILLQLNVGGGVEYPLTEKLSLYGGLFLNNGFAPDVTNPREFSLDYKGKFSDGNIRLNNFAIKLGIFF